MYELCDPYSAQAKYAGLRRIEAYLCADEIQEEIVTATDSVKG